ncbi:hypothetical protein [Vibrio rhizosphaerae]|uniref:hypothetical protein n=1 Tax=Vibrio rhizosphaerae TaxID=398736 RepID=UPI00056FC0BA|nr:hypothetical protein [Vibrio rhizosphaerae]
MHHRDNRGGWFGKWLAKIQIYGVVPIGFIAMSLEMLVLAHATLSGFVILGNGDCPSSVSGKCL